VEQPENVISVVAVIQQRSTLRLYHSCNEAYEQFQVRLLLHCIRAAAVQVAAGAAFHLAVTFAVSTGSYAIRRSLHSAAD
jgi:hypothetical protein